jgi:hypothetical protein
MKNLLTALIIAVLGIGSIAPSHGQVPELMSGTAVSDPFIQHIFASDPIVGTWADADRKAIREIVEGEIKSSFLGDYEKWSAHFAHEPYTCWMQAAQTGYWFWRGWDEISTAMKEFVRPSRAGSLILENVTDYVDRLYKDAALVTFTAKITQIIDGEKTEVTGREVRSLEKKDGKWKIIYLGTIYSSTYKK